MAVENITNKKFIDGAGAGYLWTLIKNRFNSKLDEVVAANDSISVSNDNEISVRISAQTGNAIQLINTGAYRGLYVSQASGGSGGNNDSYAIVQDASSGDYAAVYRLKKYENGEGTGTDVGVINIPKDMVVQGGAVETKTTIGEWGEAGTYIHLILANADNTNLYIPVDSLIEYVTSGSQIGDTVMVTVDPATHEITAEVADNSIDGSKLTLELRSQLAAIGNAVQSVSEGSTNGTISVDNTDVAVHGLGSAAYTNANAYDASGAADAVLGASNDTAATITVYGVKQYASDAYSAIIAMTNAEIDSAIAAVDPSANGQSF